MPDARAVRTSRSEALQVFCPDCGARPAVACTDAGRPRKSQHAQRHAEAVMRGARPVMGPSVSRVRGKYSNLRADGW